MSAWRVAFAYDDGLYQQTARAVARATYGAVTPYVALAVVAAAIIGWAIMLWRLTRGIDERAFLVAFPGGMILGYLVVRRLHNAFIRAFAERRMSGAPFDGAEVVTEADEEGVRTAVRHQELRVGWAGVDRMLASRDKTVFVAGSIGFPIPASAFETAEARAAFEAWCYDRLTPEAQERSRLSSSARSAPPRNHACARLSNRDA